MRDKGLSIFLMVLLGMGGIAILVLAWTRPMPLFDRILTSSVGSIGLGWVVIQALFLTSVRSEADAGQNPLEVKMGKSPVNRR